MKRDRSNGQELSLYWLFALQSQGVEKPTTNNQGFREILQGGTKADIRPATTRRRRRNSHSFLYVGLGCHYIDEASTLLRFINRLIAIWQGWPNLLNAWASYRKTQVIKNRNIKN